jgi:hypothetical protein
MSKKFRYVYLLGYDDSEYPYHSLVKIGYSKNPLSRLKSIKCGADKTITPKEVDISKLHILSVRHAGKHVEKYLHSTFKDSRYLGEWFDLGANPIVKFNAALNECPKSYMPKSCNDNCACLSKKRDFLDELTSYQRDRLNRTEVIKITLASGLGVETVYVRPMRSVN